MRRRIPILVACLACVTIATRLPAGPRTSGFALEVTFQVNPGGSSSTLSCHVAGDVPAHAKSHWWLARDEANGTLRCGRLDKEPSGPRDDPALEVRVTPLSGGVALLDSTLRSRGETVHRRHSLPGGGEAWLPLPLEDAEAFVRIVVAWRGDERPAHGALLVRGDRAGEEVLLDGGVVGVLGEDAGMRLNHVLAGAHEVGVRPAGGPLRTTRLRVQPGLTSVAEPGAPSRVPYRLDPLGFNPQGAMEYRREADGAIVVRIPAGEFLMGNARVERKPPEHRVHVSEFLIDRTEVSWRQYMRFAAATQTPLPPHEPFWGIRDDHPAAFVSWEEARLYCEWAGGRLPTEAEWEKAARGTDARTHPWGEEAPDPNRAVFRRSWGFAATDPVGAHPSGAGPYGLLDMAGNMWEWVQDWKDDAYLAAGPRRDPPGPPAGEDHIVRGGSWDSRPDVVNCSVRGWGPRGYREGDFGFRCAMSAQSATP